MEMEFSIWDFVRDTWRWIRSQSSIRIDHKKVRLEFSAHDNGRTELKQVDFKLSILNHTTSKIFIKFKDPIFRHDKLAYQLVCTSHDLSTTMELSPRKVTVFEFAFNFMGGLITVQQYKPNSFQFEITYIRDKKIEKIFVDEARDIAQRNVMKFEPIEDGRPTYHFREGMQLLINGDTNKADHLFHQSGYSIEDMAVLLARNGDGYLFNQKFSESIILYKRAKKYFEQAYLPQDSHIWGLLYGNLATAYCYNKEFKEALPLFEKSIAILSKEKVDEDSLKKVKQKQEECTKGDD